MVLALITVIVLMTEKAIGTESFPWPLCKKISENLRFKEVIEVVEESGTSLDSIAKDF